MIKEKGFITKTYGLELKDYDDLEQELEAIFERKNLTETPSKENLNDKEYFLINKEKK